MNEIYKKWHWFYIIQSYVLLERVTWSHF